MAGTLVGGLGTTRQTVTKRSLGTASSDGKNWTIHHRASGAGLEQALPHNVVKLQECSASGKSVSPGG